MGDSGLRGAAAASGGYAATQEPAERAAVRSRECEREKSRIVSWYHCEKGFHRAEPLEGSRELPGPRLHGETLRLRVLGYGRACGLRPQWTDGDAEAPGGERCARGLTRGGLHPAGSPGQRPALSS